MKFHIGVVTFGMMENVSSKIVDLDSLKKALVVDISNYPKHVNLCYEYELGGNHAFEILR